MDKDYEYEYELPDYGRITYPGSGYVSPYVSEYQPFRERTTKPQPKQNSDAELAQEKAERVEREAMRELVNLRNKSTVTAALTIKQRYDARHKKKPMTEEKALELAMKWWDKKNPEFSYTEYPINEEKK